MTAITEKHDTAKPEDSNNKANAGITKTDPVFSQKGNNVGAGKDAVKDPADKTPGNMQDKTTNQAKS
jgi:hypothetical protein